MRILVAVDGSHDSLTAVRETAHRLWPPRSLIRILYVDEHGAGHEPTEAPRRAHGVPPSLRDVAGHALEKAAASFDAACRCDVSVETAVRSGRAADAILAEAEAWDAELIVVGSQGKGSLERILLGSVSAAVTARAGCSVEVVRSRRRDASPPDAGVQHP
jgi:nucleotide-binding universal stress UspA family protein